MERMNMAYGFITPRGGGEQIFVHSLRPFQSGIDVPLAT
jgi:cold shock CspA family protein